MIIYAVNGENSYIFKTVEKATENFFTILFKKAYQFTYNKKKEYVECHDRLCHK